MPRTKIKKGLPEIKSEPDDGDLTNEFSVHSIIMKGDIMKSSFKELINQKKQQVKAMCDAYRKQLSEPSNIPETPYNPPGVSSFNTFTPKVAPNMSLALLRRPKLGEIMMSINGSPIMQNAAEPEVANINIPMVDGTVMSIIPEEVLPIEDVPLHVDPQAKQQLKILYNQLKDIVDN